jgi:hypothetical protein
MMVLCMILPQHQRHPQPDAPLQAVRVRERVEHRLDEIGRPGRRGKIRRKTAGSAPRTSSVRIADRSLFRAAPISGRSPGNISASARIKTAGIHPFFAGRSRPPAVQSSNVPRLAI